MQFGYMLVFLEREAEARERERGTERREREIVIEIRNLWEEFSWKKLFNSKEFKKDWEIESERKMVEERSSLEVFSVYQFGRNLKMWFTFLFLSSRLPPSKVHTTRCKARTTHLNSLTLHGVSQTKFQSSFITNEGNFDKMRRYK